MLDTIILNLDSSQFKIIDHGKFSPSTFNLFNPPYFDLGKRKYIKCVQNPTDEEIANGIRKPRLSVTKRRMRGGYGITLRIEFSAPKLLFGNNFDEIKESDFDNLLRLLHGRLYEMGIKVSLDTLVSAKVVAVHPCKNIPFFDYTTVPSILTELNKVNVSKRLDMAQTKFRNDGHALQMHCGSYEIVFYDKIRDLEQAHKGKKRSIDRDAWAQCEMFDLQNYRRGLQVLRMEVRIGKSAKLESVLSKLGIKTKPTFKRIFKKTLMRDILIQFWDVIYDDIPLLALCQFKPSEIASAIIADSGYNIKPAKLLQLIGGYCIIDGVGIRGLKSLIYPRCTSRTWQRIRKELESPNLVLRMKYKSIQDMNQHLREFKTVRMQDFRSKDTYGKRAPNSPRRKFAALSNASKLYH